MSNKDREDSLLILAPEAAGYVAGILDGEGSITLVCRRGKSPLTTVVAGNTDRAMIDWLHTHLGGRVRFAPSANPRCRPMWCWALYAIEARRVLRAVLPYLVTKRRHAEIVLAFDEARQLRHRESPILPPEPEPFASLLAELRALNRRGPRPEITPHEPPPSS